MPITAPSRGSSPRSRSLRAFRRRSPRVISLPPLPLATERPPRCVWDTKPVLPHQEDVPVSNTSPQDNHLLRVVLLLRKRSLVRRCPWPATRFVHEFVHETRRDG